MFAYECVRVCVCVCVRACVCVCVQLCLKELIRKLQGDCLICSSGSPTKRLLQITDMSRGRLAHVPAFS